jgi:hypothetical protein
VAPNAIGCLKNCVGWGASTLGSGTEDTVYLHLVDYYLKLAEQSLEGAFGPDRTQWMNRLEQEHLICSLYSSG